MDKQNDLNYSKVNNMFKVSFKNDFINVSTFQNKITIVTLKGTCALPSWFNHIPYEISNWMWTHPSVDVHDIWLNGEQSLFIEATGKAKCTDDDIFDSELGMRIAESRAKMRIYKFMYMLTKKLLCYYFGVMYGNREVDLVRESHTEPPKDCVMITCNKYKSLWIKESHHLGELLQQV